MPSIILNIVSIIVLISFSYCIYLLKKRNTINKRYDRVFGINTRGLRSWERGSLYNRTESTPYLALSSLAQEYEMSPQDKLVDFGCGKGRVAIFLHNKFNISVTGVELNPATYDEAIENINSYMNMYGENDKLTLSSDYAEEYEIKDDENKFFFFNPFDVSIFKKVVNNIVKNADEHNKEVEIILYYPLNTYKKFLKNETPFQLKQKIKASGAIGYREKFLIYKYKP